MEIKLGRMTLKDVTVKAQADASCKVRIVLEHEGDEEDARILLCDCLPHVGAEVKATMQTVQEQLPFHNDET